MPVIRTATMDAAAAIARIHVLSWQTAYAGIMPADFLARLSVDEKAVWWGRYLAGNPGGLLVATMAEVVAGFISFGPSRDADGAGKSEVYALHVAPERWAGGVGRHLIAGTEAALPPGADLTLWVLEQNQRARGFYRAVGFLPNGADKQIVVGGVSLREIRLAKKIGA